MSLRVIAGRFAGRRLVAPPGFDTRPLPDRIKQSLFDWLGDLDDLTVVDCCAGSGAFACEALSRGAKLAHVIEPGRHAQTVLKANLTGLSAPTLWKLHVRPFQQVLPQLHGIDLLFADPPFPWYREETATLGDLLALARQSLVRGGRLIIRGERGENLPELPAGLVEEERRLYGRSWIAALRRKDAVRPPLPGPPSLVTDAEPPGPEPR